MRTPGRPHTKVFAWKIASRCFIAAALAAINGVDCRPLRPPLSRVSQSQQPSRERAGLSATAEKDLQTYRDEARGVTFQYPSIWKAASPNNQNGYLPPAISDSNLVEMHEIVFFSPDWNL